MRERLGRLSQARAAGSIRADQPVTAEFASKPNRLPPLLLKELIVPTSAKLPAKPAKPRVKRLVKTPSPSAQPSLRFYYSESLRAKTLAVLATLEKAKDSTKYRNALTDIIEELTDSGMDYYFLRPLKLAGAGFFTRAISQPRHVSYDRRVGIRHP